MPQLQESFNSFEETISHGITVENHETVIVKTAKEWLKADEVAAEEAWSSHLSHLNVPEILTLEDAVSASERNTLDDEEAEYHFDKCDKAFQDAIESKKTYMDSLRSGSALERTFFTSKVEKAMELFSDLEEQDDYLDHLEEKSCQNSKLTALMIARELI